MNFYSDGWKANSTNSVIPTNSRPFANNDTNISNIGRTPFRPNPTKAPRAFRQLHGCQNWFSARLSKP